MAEKIKTTLKKTVSPVALSFMIFFLFGLIVTVISRNSAAFADFWQTKIACVPRAVLAYITNILPFSLAESVIICVPCLIAILIRYSFKNVADDKMKTVRFIVTLVSAGLLIYGMLFVNFSAGYSTSPLEERLGLDRQKVSAEELYDTAAILTGRIKDDIGEIDFIYGSSSVMPYDLKEMNKKLNEAYKKVYEKYDFISRLDSNVKPVALSEPWTYTHIAGVYTFFTGEANININFPDYTLPYTAAHEMAHQRGIAREEEANFVAFLVCMESDDPYIRYSGYVSVYEYVASALSRADKTLYSEFYSTQVPELLKCEMRAYNSFFEKYRENKIADVSEKINNGYLQAQGQKAGTKSYGLVVDLAVAYYKIPENK